MRNLKILLLAVLSVACLNSCHKTVSLNSFLDAADSEAKSAEAANASEIASALEAADVAAKANAAAKQDVVTDDNVCPRCNGSGRMLCKQCFGDCSLVDRLVGTRGCEKCGGGGSTMLEDFVPGHGHVTCSLCHGAGTKDGSRGPNVLKANAYEVALEEYHGNIGPYDIEFHFDHRINGGYYFYTDRPATWFTLVTEQCETHGNVKKMFIQEYTPKGTNSGHYFGTFDVASGKFEGSFTNSQGQSYSFELRK